VVKTAKFQVYFVIDFYLHRKMQVMGLLLKTILVGKTFSYIKWLAFASMSTNIRVLNLGPRFATPIWDPNLGPRFGGVRVKSAVDAVSAVSTLCSKSLTILTALFTHFELANQLR
jgi:hypothetical protein